MAKRRKAARRSSANSHTDILGIRYNSLTFLLFLVFVLIAAMIFVSKMLGMSLY